MSLANGQLTIRLADLTPCWLQDNYLAGLEIVDAYGRAYGPEFYETHMQNAARRVEMLCDITIIPVSIRNERHDYRATDFLSYGYLQLYKVPIRSVQEIRAIYPLGDKIAKYPDEWISIVAEAGQINLVPARGSLGTMIIGQGGDWLPLLYGQVSYVPSLWEVDYTAGMDPENLPRNVAEAIAKLACIDILTILSDLLTPLGVTSQSASIDGMSQSKSYQLPAFRARISGYINDLYGVEGKSQDLTMTSGLLKQILNAHRPLNVAAL